MTYELDDYGNAIINSEIVGVTEAGEYKIKFTNTNFDDIIFSIGKVSFEEKDPPILHFDYDIHEGTVPDQNIGEFKRVMGDYIIQSIARGIKDNSLIYSGGV